MALEAPVGQLIATVMLNLALALAIGASLSALWLTPRDSLWAARQRARLRLAGTRSVAFALLASVALLWMKAGSMAEVPLTEAGAAAWSMLTATHFGLAWIAGASALVFAAIATALPPSDKQNQRWKVLNLLALAAFLYTRSLVSHASADSDFGIRIVFDWVHLILISVWVGEVFVAGLLTLASPPAAGPDDRIDCERYIGALSTTATYALVGIVATGLLNAWYNVGNSGAVIGSDYGTALLVKLMLVAVAVLLGAYNRFFVMPSLTAALTAPPLRRFTRVLRLEAAVLLGVLIVAAILSATQPPIAT